MAYAHELLGFTVGLILGSTDRILDGIFNGTFDGT